MELENVVKGRRSIRKFKTKEVLGDVIKEILDTARWAPSWGNTQPWEFYVITGMPLEKFKHANRQAVADGKSQSPDIPMPETWPTAMKARYGDLGKTMLDMLGIKREDKEARKQLLLKMTFLFDAPCLIVACLNKDMLVEYAMLDMGLIVQTICMLAHGKGLGTLIMASAVRYPGLLREIASIPEDRRIVIGIALGYPEADLPLNTFERKRADLTELVTWVG